MNPGAHRTNHLVTAMMEAAKLAKAASTVTTNRRLVYVLVTADGLLVRGTYRDARHAFEFVHEASWRDLVTAPFNVANAVKLVVRRLEEKGEDLNIVPVRSGE